MSNAIVIVEEVEQAVFDVGSILVLYSILYVGSTFNFVGEKHQVTGYRAEVH